MLEIVIHGDENVVLSRSHTAKSCVVLAIVSRQLDPRDPRILFRERLNDCSARIPAAVVDQQNLVGDPEAGKYSKQVADERSKRNLAVVDGNNDRDPVLNVFHLPDTLAFPGPTWTHRRGKCISHRAL